MLSKPHLDAQEQNVDYSLKFKQLAQASAFNPVSGMCRLCLTEKFFTMFKPEGANINQRSGFYSVCRHKTKQLLCPPAPARKPRLKPPLFVCLYPFNSTLCDSSLGSYPTHSV